MNIDPIQMQQAALPGMKEAAASADPLAALFGDLLALVEAQPGDAAAKPGKGEETTGTGNAPLAAAMLPAPFLPIAMPLAQDLAAQASAATTVAGVPALPAADGKAQEPSVAPAAAAAVPGAPLPVAMPTPELAAAAPEEALAAVKTEAKAAKEAAAATAPRMAKPEALAMQFAPTVTLQPPKVAAPASTEKGKPALAAPAPAKSAGGPVAVTVERAAAPAAEPVAGEKAPQPAAPVNAPAHAAPAAEEEPTPAPASADPVAAPVTVAAPRASETAPVEKPAPHTAPQPLHHATEQVVHRLEKAIEGGEDRIRIELKPASLGAVEVQMRIADDGRVTAVVSADRADTLALLQNDVRGLEQALKDAGLRPDAGSLSFNLRHGDGHAGHQPDARGQRRRGNSDGAVFTIEGIDGTGSSSNAPLGGLDIRI